MSKKYATRRVLHIGAVALVAAFASCSSPTWSTAPKAYSLDLRFPLGQGAMARSLSAARLILPSAARLKVTMVPSDSRFDTRVSTMAIPAGATSVSAHFDIMAQGSWQVTATASDSTGVPILGLTSTIDIGSTAPSTSLYLLPLSAIPAIASNSFPVVLGPETIASGSSSSWTVPASSLKTDGSFDVWLDPTTSGFSGLKEYLQHADGSPMATPAQSVGAGAGSFVTVFNSGTSAATVRLLLNPLRITYDPNGATGTAPLDDKGYLAGDSTILAASTTLSKSGYAFAGWNTKADGSGTAMSSPMTIQASTTLYAQWTLATSILVSISFADPTQPAISFSNGLSTMSKTGGTMTLSATSGFASYAWSVNGAAFSAANQLTISGSDPALALGRNTVLLVVGDGTNYWSTEFTFTLTN